MLKGALHDEWIQAMGFDLNYREPGTKPDTVVMSPFKVFADNASDTPGWKDRYLRDVIEHRVDPQAAAAWKESKLFGPIHMRNETPILFDQIENMFVPSRNEALKRDDVYQPSSNFNIKIKNSSLVWKLDNHDLWSVSLRPNHGGVKVTIRRNLKNVIVRKDL